MLSEHLNIGDFNGRIYMAKHGGTIDSSLDYSLVKGGGSEKGDREAATGPLYLKIVVSKTSADKWKRAIKHSTKQPLKDPQNSVCIRDHCAAKQDGPAAHRQLKQSLDLRKLLL